MLKKFKNTFKELIDNRIKLLLEEKLSKSNNRYNINFADDYSEIYRPLAIDGGRNIYLGSNSRIGKYAWLGAIEQYQNQKFNPKLIIGNNVNVGNFACITCIKEIIIEDGCLLSEHIYISDHYHGFDAAENMSPTLQPLFTKGTIHISKNCFLGFRVSILPGVHLGKHCVVGSHSVVTKSFPDYCMIAGSPAKVIKKYNRESKVWESV